MPIDLSNDENIYLIVGVVCAAIILILLFICMCCLRGRGSTEDDEEEGDSESRIDRRRDKLSHRKHKKEPKQDHPTPSQLVEAGVVTASQVGLQTATTSALLNAGYSQSQLADAGLISNKTATPSTLMKAGYSPSQLVKAGVATPSAVGIKRKSPPQEFAESDAGYKQPKRKPDEFNDARNYDNKQKRKKKESTSSDDDDDYREKSSKSPSESKKSPEKEIIVDAFADKKYKPDNDDDDVDEKPKPKQSSKKKVITVPSGFSTAFKQDTKPIKQTYAESGLSTAFARPPAPVDYNSSKYDLFSKKLSNQISH